MDLNNFGPKRRIRDEISDNTPQPVADLENEDDLMVIDDEPAKPVPRKTRLQKQKDNAFNVDEDSPVKPASVPKPVVERITPV